MKPEFREIDRMGNSSDGRGGARVTNFLLHTQEGNGTAESLAAYLNNPNNGVSYHYTVRDGVVCDVVDTDLASWSVLSANPFTVNLCFAGSRAGWSRAAWLDIEPDIEIAAYLAVQDSHKYGYPAEVIAPPYRRAAGISDHRYVTDCLGIGTHTDVGPGFPWDVFTRYVRQFAQGEDEDMSFTDADRALLARVHRELTQPYPSRSRYRENAKPVDTLAGMVLNADARIHEDATERAAMLGDDDAAALVRAAAEAGDPHAAAILGIVDGRQS